MQTVLILLVYFAVFGLILSAYKAQRNTNIILWMHIDVLLGHCTYLEAILQNDSDAANYAHEQIIVTIKAIRDAEAEFRPKYSIRRKP